jgi:hypothetical protein
VFPPLDVDDVVELDEFMLEFVVPSLESVEPEVEEDELSEFCSSKLSPLEFTVDASTVEFDSAGVQAPFSAIIAAIKPDRIVRLQLNRTYH